MKVSTTVRILDSADALNFRPGITFEHYSYGEYDRSASWMRIVGLAFAGIVVLLGALWPA
jgi:hypothetical protein